MQSDAHGESKASETSGTPETRRRLSDRQIGIVGLWTGIILGLLGIASGYYFYVASLQERIPTALVDPTRTVIVDSSAPGSSEVSILYKGKPVGPKNVTAARIYFWNAGKLSIRPQDIYQGVRFSFPTGIDILDANVLKASREIVKPKVQVDRDTPSAVELTFNVLEQNDGIAVQIIYTGPRDAFITPEGLIADVPRGIKTLDAYSKPEDAPLGRGWLQLAMNRFNEYRTAIYSFGVLCILVVVLRYLPPEGNVLRRIAEWISIPVYVVGMWACIIFLISLSNVSEYQPLYDVPGNVLGNK
jgi:hypothetical protein